MTQPSSYRVGGQSAFTSSGASQGFHPTGAAAAGILGSVGHQLNIGGSGGIGGHHTTAGAALLGSSLVGGPAGSSMRCPSHPNKDIVSYCRSHAAQLCEDCQNEHFFDSQPLIAGAHYQASNADHDIVRIDKYLTETVNSMNNQLQSFNVFVQTKKSGSGLQYFSGAGGKHSEPLFQQLIQDDRIFEEAHNNMIHRLTTFQNLSQREKINCAVHTLAEFNKIYEVALSAKTKIQDYIDRSASLASQKVKDVVVSTPTQEKVLTVEPVSAVSELLLEVPSNGLQNNNLVEQIILQPTIVPIHQVHSQLAQMLPPQPAQLKINNVHHELEAREQVLAHGASAALQALPNSQIVAGLSKKNSQRRKHWPIICTVTLPNSDDTLRIETNTSLKVKDLKALIKSKSTAAELSGDIALDRIQLQIDGGAILKKSSVLLDDAGIKNNTNLLLSIVEGSGRGGAQSTQNARDRRALKDEPKVPIIYTLRNPIEAAPKEENAEAAEVSALADDIEMINTSSKRDEAARGVQRKIEIAPSSKVKNLRLAIKEDLGIKDKVNLKLYLPSSDEHRKQIEQEEVKEGELRPSIGLDYLMETNEVIITDDKLSLKETGLLEQRDKLEVEIVIKLSIDVQGKGKDYAATLEISPDEFLQQALHSRLAFFKTFHQQRRMNLYIVSKDSEPILVDDLNKTFREWGIKEDGAILQLREPSKKGSHY